MVEKWLGGWTDSPQVALLLILLAMLVLGCFLDATAILVMTAPFLAPLAASLGLDPVHFEILMICMVMIGGITPPFGILMFIACQLTGATMAGFVRDVVPFLIVLLAAVLLAAFVPQCTYHGLLVPRRSGRRRVYWRDDRGCPPPCAPWGPARELASFA
jgi:TRAP-type C4-dicarboxylate transport system permease large subunit